LFAHAEVDVHGQNDAAYSHALRQLGDGRVLLDLAGLFPDIVSRPTYHGICW
jgi:hypothetical protein